MKIKFLLPGLLIAISLFWLFLAKDNYFHWDEWVFFMNFNNSPLLVFTSSYGEHFIPLNFLNHYLLFKIFGLDYLPYQIMPILFHVLNCFLLYKITLKETGNKMLAILALVLFGVSNVYNEDLIWSQGISNVASATFVSLSY